VTELERLKRDYAEACKVILLQRELIDQMLKDLKLNTRRFAVIGVLWALIAVINVWRAFA
jgi:hypothetical protein